MVSDRGGDVIVSGQAQEAWRQVPDGGITCGPQRVRTCAVLIENDIPNPTEAIFYRPCPRSHVATRPRCASTADRDVTA